MNPRDVNLRDLAQMLPCRLPDGQHFVVGDTVIVRLKKQKKVLHKARVLTIELGGESVESLTLGLGNMRDSYLEVCINSQGSDSHPIWPGEDIVYSFAWVDDWAGTDLTDNTPSIEGDSPSRSTTRASRRLQKLVGGDDT